MKPPAFQFYADDFVAGVVDLSTEDVGAYILLLCFQWGRGNIPATKSAIDRIAGCNVSSEVLAKFPDGKNPRLEIERQKQAEFRSKQVENGKRRWLGIAKPQGLALPSHMPNDSSPSPSPILTHTHTAEIPTWDEVKTAAGMSGIPEASAKGFYDHHEGNSLWVNQHGAAINWRHKLKTWGERDKANPKHAEAPKSDGPTLTEVKAHAANKHGNGGATNYAASFWQFWQSKQWRKNGKRFDWQMAFDMSYAKHRAAKQDENL